MTSKKQNVAGRLAEYFVTSKMTALFVLSSILIGLLAVALTPREENPQIIVPAAEVQVALPGASAEEVEKLLVRPLETDIKQITGVDHVYATAVNSGCGLMVQFKVGQDKEKSLVRLHDSVMGRRNLLPPEASMPVIRSVDVDDVPVVTVTLTSEKYDDYALKRIADRMLDALKSQDTGSVSYVKGGRDREIRIELDPERMQAFKVTLDQVRKLISAANISSPLGTQVQSDKNLKLSFNGFLTTEDDLKRLIVGGSSTGRPIYLGDIAHVVDAPPTERDKLARFAYGPADSRFGKSTLKEMPAVTIAVAKKRGTNAVFFANALLKRVSRLQKQIVPEGIDVVVTRNDGKKADDAVNLLIEHLGIAVLSVFIVAALFLGLKEAVIIGTTVPLILSLTLGSVFLFGLTINRVTLFALIMSLGLVVDAAIVVIENIHRNYSKLRKGDKRKCTVNATNEIGNPTNLATVAVMAVFVSLLPILSGMPGQYFRPVGITVPIAMAASLLVAYCVVPWAANRWLKTVRGEHQEEHETSPRLQRIYRSVLTPFIDNARWRNYLFAVVMGLIALSSLQPLWQYIRPCGVSGPQSFFGVETSLLLKDNTNTFNITIDMPETTPLERTDQLTREIGEILQHNPEVMNYQTTLGEAGIIDFNGMLRGATSKSGPYVGEIRVNLTDKKIRHVSSIVIARKLREQITPIAARYPGCSVRVVEDPPGPPMRAMVMAEIYGQDLQQIRGITDLVTSEFKKTFDMIEIKSSEVEDIPENKLAIDHEKAAISGVTAGEVALALRRLVDGETMGSMHIQNEENVVPIRLQVPRRHHIDPNLLSRITLTNQRGQQIALSELVHVVPSVADRPIQHKDGERVVFVGGEISQTSQIYAVIDLNKRLGKLQLPTGTRLVTDNLGPYKSDPDTINGPILLWEGEMRLMLDTYRDLIFALVLAVVCIFLILVAYYQSFRVPAIAMAAMPLSLVGIFPGHWLMNKSFSATSMVGVIALAGVVVRSSLLIIDFVNDYCEHGMTLRDAILEAGAVRLRPITLTALAIIFGSLIMLTDPVFSGLAISLIFGTAASTILTIFVVPLLLYVGLRKKMEMSGKTAEHIEEAR